MNNFSLNKLLERLKIDSQRDYISSVDLAINSVDLAIALVKQPKSLLSLYSSSQINCS